MNKPPVLPTPAPLTVKERSIVGTSFGPAVAASDPDAGDVLTFSLYPTAVFNISSTSGQVYVAAAVLNYWVTQNYSVTVRVTDGGGLFREAPLLVRREPSLVSESLR